MSKNYMTFKNIYILRWVQIFDLFIYVMLDNSFSKTIKKIVWFTKICASNAEKK